MTRIADNKENALRLRVAGGEAVGLHGLAEILRNNGSGSNGVDITDGLSSVGCLLGSARHAVRSGKNKGRKRSKNQAREESLLHFQKSQIDFLGTRAGSSEPAGPEKPNATANVEDAGTA